jgi:hypothetical protein
MDSQIANSLAKNNYSIINSANGDKTNPRTCRAIDKNIKAITPVT